MVAPFAKLVSNRPVQYAAQGLGTRVRQQLLRQKFLRQAGSALEANFGAAGQNIVEHGSAKLPGSLIRGAKR